MSDPGPCPCIHGAATLHEGHCYLAELPDDWQLGDDHCHKAEWDALRNQRGVDDAPPR